MGSKTFFNTFIFGVSILVSFPLYSNSNSNSFLSKEECKNVFIQIPYTNTEEIDFNGSEKVLISRFYPIEISYLKINDLDQSTSTLWKSRLKKNRDIKNIFLNLVEKSKLSFDDSIWVLVKIASQLDQDYQYNLSWKIYCFIANILGLGDLFNLTDKIVEFNTSSSWLSAFKYWNQDELQKTYTEYLELKKYIFEYRSGIVFDESYKILEDFLDPNFKNSDSDNLLNTEDNHYLGKIPKRLYEVLPRFKNIYQILNKDRMAILILLTLASHTNHEDVIFWEAYTKKLLKKTLSVIDLGLDTVEELKSFLSSEINSSSFLKDYVEPLSYQVQEIIYTLEDLKNMTKKRINSSFFKDMPYTLTASNNELFKYVNSQVLYLYSPTWKLTVEPRYIISDLDKALKQFPILLVNTYNYILKDPSGTSKRYDYFLDFNYLSTNQKYKEYLMDKYGVSFYNKLIKLIEIDRQ